MKRWIAWFTLGWSVASSGALQAASPVDINALMQQYHSVQTAPALSMQRNTILIFVSFSMPTTSLKQWLAQAYQVGAPVLLRGFINNSFAETTKALMDVLPNHQSGVQIDPPSFERYHITQVPAVVMTTPNGDVDVVYGNASLAAALAVFEKQGHPATQQEAKNLLAMIGGEPA